MNTALISIDEQIWCVERELKLRENLYRKLIAEGKKTRQECVAEFKAMEEVLRTLKIVAGGELGTFLNELQELAADEATASMSLLLTMQELGKSAVKIQQLEVLRDELREGIKALEKENTAIVKRYGGLSAAEVVERARLEHEAQIPIGGML